MLFSDIEGSTDLVHRLGDAWLEVLATQRRLCRAAWSAWNGVEMGTEGDSFFVVFGDAVDAVDAALDAQAAINAQTWPEDEHVRIRVGIHYGPAVRHENGFVGVDVHRAARVSGAAHGGQVLVSGVVEEMAHGRRPERWRVLDLGSHPLKGIPQPEHLFQVSTDGLPSVFPPPRVPTSAETELTGVADYRFIRPMGESTHGELYLAVPPERLTVQEQFVTVKVMSGADDEATLRRMTRELSTFAAVRSPYLVRVLDAGRQHDMFFYAMEHCPLGTLAVPTRPLQRADVVAAVADVARAAHALHEAGLVHRGIKPSNVLLVDGGGRLGDLGLVRALEPTHTMTSLGAISGLEYVEAAQLSGEAATPTSDVYSLAATLHRGLAGEGLYGELPADDPLLSVRRILTGTPRISSRLDARDAALVESVILAPPDSRPTALELAQRLESIA